MFKNAIILLGLLAITCISSDLYLKHCIAQQHKSELAYRLAFASIGAILLESRIDCWATIKTDTSEAELKEMLERALRLLDLPCAGGAFYQEKNNRRSLRYHLAMANMQYELLLQSNDETNNTNILISIINQGGDRLPRPSVLRELYDFTVYYQYKGVMEARPDQAGREILLDVLFANLQAESSSRYRDDHMSSGTGYSRVLPVRPAKVAGYGTNLQAAIRATTKGDTEVLLGTPLLLCDY